MIRRLLPVAMIAGCGPRGWPAPATPITVSDSTLSILERQGADCVWHRGDPVAGSDVEVYRFNGSCSRVRIAWSTDGGRAVVRIPSSTQERVRIFDGSDPILQDAPPRALVEVTLSDGSARELPLPPQGEVRDVGYDDLGLVALTEHLVTPGWLRGEWDQLLRRPPPSEPLLFRTASRWDGRRWRTIETVQVAGGGGSVRNLEVFDRLGPRTTRSPFMEQSVDAARTKAASKLFPASGWWQLVDGENRVLFPAGVPPTNVLFEDSRGLRNVKSWPTYRYLSQAELHGRFLLAGEEDDVSLVDVIDDRIVWQGTGSVRLWPRAPASLAARRSP